MAKSRTWLVIVVCMVFVMAGCSQSGSNTGNEAAPSSSASPASQSQSPAPADSQEPVKLTLAHGWTGEVAMAAAFEPAVEQFMKDNPNISLTVETAPGNAIREKIVTEMAANDPPDVFLHWGVRDTESYIVNNKIADLTDLINGDSEMEDRYIDNAYASSTYKGKIYGLPIEAYMMTFLVNERMFEDHGVQIPSTFSELKDAVTAFKDKGLIPIAANDGTTRAMLANLSDQLYGDSVRDRLEGKLAYDETLVQVAELAKELIDMKAFPEGMETMSTLQALELFNAEKAPMYFQHSWTLGSIDEEIIDDVNVIPFPKVKEDGNHYLTAGVGYFVYISQQAYEDEQKRQAAWELAKYLAGPVVGEELEAVAGNPSPVKKQVTKELHPVMAKALSLRDSGTVVVFPDHNDLLSSEASKEYNDLKTRLYLNDITPEEYAERFKQAIEQYPNRAFE